MTSQTIQVGKKNAVYIPKRVAEIVGITEGDKLILEVRSDGILLKPVKQGITIPKPWTEVSPEEVEEVGIEISKKILSQKSSP